ncbi:MAG: LuxR C-terminal-related transcriptional regulator, partial [Actinobacteria bacterium]|nr:LuxR C-terminal-related transcriptional regulator [Actinomycetota bacterium]
MQPETAWPLVGRDEELSVIADLLGEPGPRGVVISGAAGTGKTRLAQETLAMAREAGSAKLRVAGSRAAATVPLGVFAPLLPARHGDDAATFEGLRWAAQALLDRAHGRRLVMVVDDAHHLDPASAALTHQLALDGPVTVVATVRSEEPAPDAVIALWKDGLTPRLELQPLSQEESVRLLRLALSGEVEMAAAHRLWQASSGNPLFLRELVLAAVDGGVLVEDRGVWSLAGQLQLSPSIRDLVRQRLTGATAADRTALHTLAFAYALGFQMLRALHPEADLESLERRGMIQLDTDGRRRPVTLAHPMYGEVLRDRAPGTTAVTIAERLTTAVEKLGARRREDVLQVAVWRLVTGGVVEPGLLATAAHQAYHAADFDLAERLARAARATGSQPSVAVLLAQLLDEQGEHEEAEDLLASVDLSAMAPPLQVRAALARADNLFFGLGRESEAHEVLADAERACVDTPAGELVANRAWFELHAGQPQAALELLTAIGSDDVHGLVAADIVRSWAKTLLGDTTAALRAAEDATRREQPPAYPTVSRHEGFPELARGFALLHAGHLNEAEQIAQAGLTASLPASPTFVQARWTTLVAATALERGQLITAASSFQQAAALQRRLGQNGQLRANLSGQVVAASQAGAVAEAIDTMKELDQIPDNPERLHEADVLSAKAWLSAARGERSKATRLLGEAAAAARGRDLVTIEARVQHDRVRLGDPVEAAARLAQLADRADSGAVRARAQHAAATVDGSAETLEHAAAGLERSGLWLLAAEAFMSAATAYTRAGRRRGNACTHRATTLQERCESARTPALLLEDHVAPLTPREREVVTMAADGLPSKTIAERLVISIRTVNNLIQRAYIKLGVHSRAEAAE